MPLASSRSPSEPPVGRLRPVLGLVLAGGGARGAYEVGVLSYLAERLPRLLEHIRVITGTSVGAVNGTFLASRGLTPEAVYELAGLWKGLDLDHLVQVSHFGAAKMLGAASLRFLGRSPRSPKTALLEVQRIQELVAKETDWRGIHRHLRALRFDAIAVCATNLRTGHAHLFLERRGSANLGRVDSPDPLLVVERVLLGPHHVLASAAIPFLFPPVEVGGNWYIDGGVRHNAPLSPALALGAESLLVVNTRALHPVFGTGSEFPGLGQILGTLFDSVFLDRLSFDLDRLTRMNDVLEFLERQGLVSAFQGAMVEKGRRAYRPVPFAHVAPTEDIGQLAATYLKSAAGQRASTSFLRVLRALFEDDQSQSADAASYLCFDGGFTRELIALGHRDAAAQHSQLEALIASTGPA